MRPLVYALLCPLVACPSLAAPLPKPDIGSFRSSPWSKPIDPDKLAKFTFGKGSVTIALPAKDIDYSPELKKRNAPRLVRDVEGDFAVEFRVSGNFDASEKVISAPGRKVISAAGLLLLSGDKDDTCVRFAFGAARDGDESAPHALLGQQSASGGGFLSRYGRRSEGWPLAKDATRAYLRVEVRHGDDGMAEVRPLISPDGKKWVNPLGDRLRAYFNLPKKHKLALAAFSLSKTPLKVTFDRFKVTALPAERPGARKPGK